MSDNIMDVMAMDANIEAGIPEPNKPGFEVYNNQGFMITFDNGITVSVQFGNANYCDNASIYPKTSDHGRQCGNAEIAIWTRENTYVTHKYLMRKNNGQYDVKGWCTPKEVLDAMAWAKNYKGD